MKCTHRILTVKKTECQLQKGIVTMCNLLPACASTVDHGNGSSTGIELKFSLGMRTMNTVPRVRVSHLVWSWPDSPQYMGTCIIFFHVGLN